ncbi:MAG: C-GCAxxG-C-C family protein [Proteobacteria bacterium]|nr:C-GCAxxG-C-C family protein [Pseudomonadota bacterium]
MVYAFREESGLSEEMALKIACGLGAGMARKGEVCGAVTGGILVLGMRHGRGSKDDRSAQERTYAKTRELMDRFSEKHGTVICRNLLNGCELTTKEGQKYFMDNDLLNKVCVPCVQSVILILEGNL